MGVRKPTSNGKTCANCKKFKVHTEFRKDVSKLDGLRYSCKQCERRRRRESYRANHEENKRKQHDYYQKHRGRIIQSVKASYRRRQEKVLKQKALYRAENRDKIIETLRAHRRKNRDRLVAEQRAHYQANREKLTAAKRAARQANPEKAREINRQWRLNNPQRAAQLQREGYQKHKHKRVAWEREYRRKNANRRISVSLRNRLNAVLRGNVKVSSVLALLGCSLNEFKKHFQSKFTEGMSWQKFLNGEIHIDHTIPCASYDLSKEAEQRSCFHFSNLQPLWARDNLRKGKRTLQVEITGRT